MRAQRDAERPGRPRRAAQTRGSTQPPEHRLRPAGGQLRGCWRHAEQPWRRVQKVLGKCTPVAYKNPGLNIKKYRINQKKRAENCPGNDRNFRPLPLLDTIETTRIYKTATKHVNDWLHSCFKCKKSLDFTSTGCYDKVTTQNHTPQRKPRGLSVCYHKTH